jgi:hypothetical protein
MKFQYSTQFVSKQLLTFASVQCYKIMSFLFGYQFPQEDEVFPVSRCWYIPTLYHDKYYARVWQDLQLTKLPSHFNGMRLSVVCGGPKKNKTK